MEKTHYIKIIKVTALIIGALGIYSLIKTLPHWRDLLLTETTFSHYYFAGQPIYIGILWILMEFIPPFLLISFWGVFNIKLWGRILAIGVLSVDFAIRLFGAIKAWTYYLIFPEMKVVHQAMIDAFENQHSGETLYVKVVSMWPSYIVGLVDIMLLVILFYPPIKEIFKTWHNPRVQMDAGYRPRH